MCKNVSFSLSVLKESNFIIHGVKLKFNEENPMQEFQSEKEHFESPNLQLFVSTHIIAVRKII